MTMAENTHEMHTSPMDTAKYAARNGKPSEEDGSLSCTSNRKTVVESRTVICKVIFSSEKGGKTKPMKVKMLIKKPGKIIVIV